MNKKLPSNEKFIIPMINLDEASSSALTKMIENAPQYNRRQFRDLIKNTIGAIHQIPNIFSKANAGKKIDLKNIEAYFGRSSAAADEPGKNLANRFRAHREHIDRRHIFGMIIAKTTIENTLLMEKFGISIIETLKKKDGLCIANKTSYSKGGVGETEPGLLYLTFKINGLDDSPANILTNAQINSAVKIVMKELGLDIKEDEVVASAAKLAFEASNEIFYQGEQELKMYSPDTGKYKKPSYSASKIKTLFS